MNNINERLVFTITNIEEELHASSYDITYIFGEGKTFKELKNNLQKELELYNSLYPEDEVILNFETDVDYVLTHFALKYVNLLIE